MWSPTYPVAEQNLFLPSEQKSALHGVLHIGLGTGVGVGDVRTVEQPGVETADEYDEMEDGETVECDRVTGRETVDRVTGRETADRVAGRETEVEYVEVASRVAVVERDMVAG